MNHHVVPKVPGRQPGLALRLGSAPPSTPHPPLLDQDQISLDVSNLLFTLQKLSGRLLSHQIIQVENHLKQGETFEQNSLVCLCLAVEETVTSSPVTIHMRFHERSPKEPSLLQDILISFLPQIDTYVLLQDSRKREFSKTTCSHQHHRIPERSWRRSSLTNAGRGISARPRQPRANLTCGQMPALCVCVCV